jgi:hypothetical protein
MEEVIRTLEERIAEAEKRLNEANTLIGIGESAGMDVTAYKIKANELRAEIDKWKRALEKYKSASAKK